MRCLPGDRLQPHVPTFDPAGVSTDVGEGVNGWSARDAVVASLPMTASGAAAEHVAAPAGGAFVSTTTPGPEDAARGVRTVQVFMRSDAARLAELVARVDAGTLRIDVAERRPLADLATVHDQAAAGRPAGKTVLLP